MLQQLGYDVALLTRTGSTYYAGGIPCDNNYSGAPSRTRNTRRLPRLPCQSACNPTSGMSHAVSPPQPAKSAWLPGLFLRSCGGDFAVSPIIETLIFETSSSRSNAPLLRPTTPHILVAPTFVPQLCALSHLYHPAQFALAHHTSGEP